MDTRERIFELIAKSGLEQKTFASQIGVIPQTVTDWKNQKSKSYTKYIPKIAEALGTTTEYLLTGEGPKYKASTEDGPNSDTQNEGQLMAAFFEGGQDLSEEEMTALWQDAKDYIQWKLSQRRKAKNDQ